MRFISSPLSLAVSLWTDAENYPVVWVPYVNNGTLKMLGEKLSAAGLSPTTIHDVAKVMRWVRASAVDENGDQIYPTKWNYEFADVPVVENQRTPMFTGEEITKIIAKAEKQANCSVSK